MALDNTKIKSKTSLDVVLALNKLGENNQFSLDGLQHTAAIWEMKRLTLLLKEEQITQMQPRSSCRFQGYLGRSDGSTGGDDGVMTGWWRGGDGVMTGWWRGDDGVMTRININESYYT